VFTTLEGAATKSFGYFLDKKRTLQQLDCIVIDKCYTMFKLMEAWQPNMLRLLEITSKGTQLVYLIAIMLPMLQLAFLDLAGLDSKELDVIYNKSTTQHNLIY
jgi:hypothetical protein